MSNGIVHIESISVCSANEELARQVTEECQLLGYYESLCLAIHDVESALLKSELQELNSELFHWFYKYTLHN